MNSQLQFRSLVLGLCTVLALACHGCSKQEAVDTVKDAEKSAEEAVETIEKGVGDAVEEGEQMVTELSEKAAAYLSPLKDRLGSLESLKESPGELKTAVTELIQSIEDRAEDIRLPESVSNALASLKEKLIALRDYLEGEVEQAKIDAHLRDIMESVKSGLGMSND